MTVKLIAGILAIIIVLVFMLVVSLPSKRSATKSVKFDHSCVAVWQVYTDVTSQPNWRPDVEKIELLKQEFPRSWVEVFRHGPAITFAEVVSTPGETIELVFDAEGRFRGDYQATFSPIGEGCVGSFTETVQLEGIFTKLMSYVFFDPARSIQKYADEAAVELQRRHLQ
jgi:hypothetical protein